MEPLQAKCGGLVACHACPGEGRLILAELLRTHSGVEGSSQRTHKPGVLELYACTEYEALCTPYKYVVYACPNKDSQPHSGQQVARAGG